MFRRHGKFPDCRDGAKRGIAIATSNDRQLITSLDLVGRNAGFFRACNRNPFDAHDFQAIVHIKHNVGIFPVDFHHGADKFKTSFEFVV